jgi:catechol 2,3-dioxygenase-like lactoylglutathione lyase family enzyme
MPQILDHVDVRVRDRDAASIFYDTFLRILGAVKREGDEFTTWRIPPPGGLFDEAPDNFGITQARDHVPGQVRIAFKAASRDVVDAAAKALKGLGVRNLEWDEGIYGDDYYGIFFDDPDGNRLELCVNRG